MENTKLKNSINFLLFSYFGITLENNADEILSASVDRAYRDASSHVLSVDESKKEKIKKDAKKLIIKQIKELKPKDEYDGWHNEMCNLLAEKYSEDVICMVDDETKKRKFTYGIAQKWINMTMKYLYLLNSIYREFNSECDFCMPNGIGDKVSKLSQVLHVPVDSYIIESVWEEKSVKLPLKNNKKREHEYKNPAEQVEPWSKWENKKNETEKYIIDGTYTDFQTSLHEFLSEKFPETDPIDWEGPVWIKKAKERKEQKDDKK